MAYIPPSWEAYERLQRKLSSTSSIAHAAALEEALNVILQPDFVPGAVDEEDFSRVAASAARQERHRATLRARARHSADANLAIASFDDDTCEIGLRPSCIEDALHARKQLARLAAMLREPDWELLMGVAVGTTYNELAQEQAASATALRSRVCRLRELIAAKAANW